MISLDMTQLASMQRKKDQNKFSTVREQASENRGCPRIDCLLYCEAKG